MNRPFLTLVGLAATSLTGVAAAQNAVTEWNNIAVASASAGNSVIPPNIPNGMALYGRTVIEWNLTGVTTFLQVAPTLGPRSAPLGSRAMAMMHVAMADAVFSIHPVYKPYAVRLRGHGSADQVAAAAAAAHGVLVRLFPSEQVALDAALANSLSQVRGWPKKERRYCGRRRGCCGDRRAPSQRRIKRGLAVHTARRARVLAAGSAHWGEPVPVVERCYTVDAR